MTSRPPSHDLYDQGIAIGGRDGDVYRFRWMDEDYTVPGVAPLTLGAHGHLLTAPLADVRAHATDRITRAELAQRLRDEIANRQSGNAVTAPGSHAA